MLLWLKYPRVEGGPDYRAKTAADSKMAHPPNLEDIFLDQQDVVFVILALCILSIQS
jgi:hypothetical protein